MASCCARAHADRAFPVVGRPHVRRARSNGSAAGPVAPTRACCSRPIQVRRKVSPGSTGSADNQLRQRARAPTPGRAIVAEQVLQPTSIPTSSSCSTSIRRDTDPRPSWRRAPLSVSNINAVASKPRASTLIRRSALPISAFRRPARCRVAPSRHVAETAGGADNQDRDRIR